MTASNPNSCPVLRPCHCTDWEDWIVMKYKYVDNYARKCEIFILHYLVFGRLMYNLGVKYMSFIST